MNQIESLYRLKRLYVFTGELQLTTALHLGGGDPAFSVADSPVMRRADGLPFIPGSSIKGAFRATVEKFAATLGLLNMHLDALDNQSDWQRRFAERRQGERDDRGQEIHGGRPWTDEQTIEHVRAEWPATAALFGTPYTASHILFQDAMPLAEDQAVVQRRDGVAIDRDSERAVEGLKYDYEVVAPTATFHFEATLRDPEELDLQLACIGLSELAGGFFSLGGKRSSGLGRCQLQNLHIYELDLTVDDLDQRIKHLQRYLTGASLDQKLTLVASGSAALDWLHERIDALLQECLTAEGGNDA